MLAIRKAAIEDIPAAIRLANAVYVEWPTDEAEALRDQEVLPPDQRSQFWLAEQDGSAVGTAELGRDIGSYHPLKWTVLIAVLPDARRKGVGSALFEAAKEGFGGEAPLKVKAWTIEGDQGSNDWAARRSFVEVKRDFDSEVDLTTYDKRLLDAYDREALSPDVSMQTFDKLDSPEFRTEFHQLFEVVRIDTPRTDPPTPMAFEDFEKQVLDNPWLIREALHIAIAGGKPVGFCGFFKSAEEGRLDQWLTAVHRDHRGHGLATALKVSCLRWALGSGFKRVRTDNDTRNAPMLAINDKLGFRRLTGLVTMEWMPTEPEPADRSSE